MGSLDSLFNASLRNKFLTPTVTFFPTPAATRGPICKNKRGLNAESRTTSEGSGSVTDDDL